MTVDPTALLAELAAIQRDVRTVAADQNLALLDGKSERAIDRIDAGIASLISSIAAPPPTEPASVNDGGRCHHCGHYEISYAKASEQHAHCPSCSRHTRWIRVPPAVDNGMLAAVNARLADLEGRIGALVVSAAEVEADHARRIFRLESLARSGGIHG